MSWWTRRIALGLALMFTFMAVVAIVDIFAPERAPKGPVILDVPADACPKTIGLNSLRCEINAVRKLNGLPQLRVNRKLRAAALAHAQDMVKRHYFAHDSPEGKNVKDRAAKALYLQYSTDYSLGENIAWGTGPLATPSAVVNGWMHSPPHRAVILTRKYSEGGAGIVHGTPDGDPNGLTYVMVLGSRKLKNNPLQHTKG